MRKRKKRSFKSKLAGAVAVAIVAINLMPLVAYGDAWQGKAWKGHSWEGHSWEGKAWDGEPWDGKSWDGKSWKGKSWDGKSWEGESWEGKPWDGNPSDGSSENGNHSDSGSGDPNNEGSTGGAPDSSDPGDGSTHGPNDNPQIRPAPNVGDNENGQIDPNGDDESSGSFQNTIPYETGKTTFQGMLQGANAAANNTLFDSNGNLKKIQWKKINGKHLARDIARTAVGNYVPEGLTKTGLDTWTGIDNAKDIKKIRDQYKAEKAGKEVNAAKQASNSYKDANAVKNASKTKKASMITKVKNAAKKTGDMGKKAKNYLGKLAKNPASKFLGKMAPWTAAASGTLSSVEAVDNFSHGNVTDGVGSVGETMMSGAAVMAAVPGVGTAAAAVVGGVGLGLWAGSKVVKHWDTVSHAVTHPIDTAKKAAKGVADGAKKVADGAKSLWHKVTPW